MQGIAKMEWYYFGYILGNLIPTPSGLLQQVTRRMPLLEGSRLPVGSCCLLSVWGGGAGATAPRKAMIWTLSLQEAPTEEEVHTSLHVHSSIHLFSLQFVFNQFYFIKVSVFRVYPPFHASTPSARNQRGNLPATFPSVWKISVNLIEFF